MDTDVITPDPDEKARMGVCAAFATDVSRGFRKDPGKCCADAVLAMSVNRANGLERPAVDGLV